MPDIVLDGRKMKVLITGVAGFIGSNLAERLSAEKRHPDIQNKESDIKFTDLDIIGIDNLDYGVKEQVPEGVQFHQVDIRSEEIYPLFEGVDFVFHLAAKNCISDCQEEPVEAADVNITGTVNVFEAARRARVRKVIYAETSALYEGSSIFPTPEKEVNPDTFYAVSKLATNYFANAYKTYFNFQFTALRHFNVYGPRQDYRRTIPPVMSAFIIKLLKGEPPIIYGTGEKRRDFVYVDDVNDFHLLCLEDKRTDDKVFNIGSGKNYSILEIYEIISNLVGVKIAPVFKPDLPGDVFQNLADITEAKKLAWKSKTDITEGLAKMVEYIKHEFKEGNIT